jgi:hypothetical protein
MVRRILTKGETGVLPQSIDYSSPCVASFSERLEVPICHKRGVNKHPQWVWKPKRKKHYLVMGMDVGLEEACNLSLCALVGRLAYRDYCSQKMSEWMKSSWEPVLGYST